MSKMLIILLIGIIRCDQHSLVAWRSTSLHQSGKIKAAVIMASAW